jgi:hypothetical protein
VLLVGVVFRLSGVVMLAYVIPLVWHQLPHPGWSALLAAVLCVVGLAVAGYWLRQGRLSRWSLVADVPLGAVALVLGELLGRHGGAIDWASFPYPYAVFTAVALGLVCRSPVGALACGSTWAAAYVLGALAFGPTTVPRALAGTVSFLVNPLIGYVCARLLRQAAEELERASRAALAEAAALAAEAERSRQARALHDRLLQVLEALVRDGAVGDEAVRNRLAVKAAWLRSYVSTGRVEQSADLVTALAAVAGTDAEVLDACLHATDPTGGLTPDQQAALVTATGRVIEALSGAGGEITVRAAPERGGVLVSVLSTGAQPPSPGLLGEMTALLDGHGGRADGESVPPYVELWLPTPL